MGNGTRAHPIGPVRTSPLVRYEGRVAHHPHRSRTAFAEGRRLRRAAERRAAERRRVRHLRGRTVTGRRAVLAALLLLPVAAVAMMALAVVLLLTGALVLAGAATLVVGGVAFTAVRRRRALRHPAGPGPLPGRRSQPGRRPQIGWADARDRFHRLAAAYAAHECDPMSVLARPALSDVTVASTGRFVEAFAQTQALESDAFPGEEHAASFVRAVESAERAWRAAREAADRIRLSGLSPAERRTVEKVIKLLTTARDSDHEPERLAAYSRARTELARLDAAGVVHLPRTAAAALDAAARGALPT